MNPCFFLLFLSKITITIDITIIGIFLSSFLVINPGRCIKVFSGMQIYTGIDASYLKTILVQVMDPQVCDPDLCLHMPSLCHNELKVFHI